MKQPGSAPGPAPAYVDRLCMQAQRLRAIPRLSVAARGDPERLMTAVCSVMPMLLAADGVAVFVEDGRGQLRVRAAAGFPERFTRWASLPALEITQLRERVGGVLRLAGVPSQWPCPEALLPSGSRVAMWVPIEQRGRTAGGLFFGRDDATQPFSDDDCLFAEVLAEFLGARLGEMALARRLDRMRRGRLQHARLAALGELTVSSAANLLASMDEVAARVERAVAQLAPGRARDETEQIRRELRGAERLARSLSLFAGGGPEEPRRAVAVEEILAAMAELVGTSLEADGIRLELGWEEDLPLLRCCPGELGQALLQLVRNARQSLNRRYPEPNPGKQLRLGARYADGHIELEVWDAGCGLAVELRDRLADPTRAAGAGGGAGLGLLVCREVIQAHGGRLLVEGEEGRWASFVILLPLEVLA